MKFHGNRTSGFTLLEVMLAFALLAVGLGLLAAIQSGGLHQVRRGADISEASLHAQSLLDTLGVLEPIEPGSRQGEFAQGRYRWSLVIELAEDPAALLAALPEEALPISASAPAIDAPVLYRIVLDVDWAEAADGQRLRFVTYRARRPLTVTP